MFDLLFLAYILIWILPFQSRWCKQCSISSIAVWCVCASVHVCVWCVCMYAYDVFVCDVCVCAIPDSNAEEEYMLFSKVSDLST